MTCAAARKPSPCVLHAKPLVLVRPDNVDWGTFRRPANAPDWQFTTRDLIVWSACFAGIGFVLGFMALAFLIAFYGAGS